MGDQAPSAADVDAYQVHGWEQPDHPAVRRRKGIQLTIAAWAVEFIAAAIGLFIAIATALATRAEIVDAGGSGGSASDWMTIFIGALPFLMVAIVELTKIPLANAFYFSQSIIWKTIFISSLFLLIFITFETMLNGFQRNFESRVYLITELKAKLANAEAEAAQIKSESERLASLTAEAAQQELERAQNEIRTNRDSELEPLNKQRTEILEGASPGNLSALQDERKRLQKQIDDLRAAEQNEINETRKKFQSDSQSFDNRLSTEKEQIATRLKELDQQISSLNSQQQKELSECYFCGDEVRTRYGKLIADRALERTKLIEQRDRLTGASAGADLRDGLTKAIENLRASYSSRVGGLEARIRTISDQLDSRQRRSASESKPLLAAIQERREEVLARHSLQLQQAKVRFDGQMAEVETRQKRIAGLNEAIARLETDRNQIRNDINLKAKDNQIFQIAALTFGREAPADVTKDEIKIVSFVWFGSLSLIVAVTGTVLAFAGLVVRYHERRPRQTLGDLLAPVGAFARALQKLVADIRRKVRQPKIKVVTQTVEVAKEIIREIPVDRIVFKEVPREVVKKELVYVPLFTNDPDLLNVDFSLGAKPKEAAD